MSKLSEVYNQRRINNINYFFGKDAKASTDGKEVISFTHYVDDDNIIVVTNDVKYWANKDQYVLLVDKNKIVYLKAWQVQLLKNWELGVNMYAIKLNRNFFKVYAISFQYDDMAFEKENTFDDLVNVAKEQDNTNIRWKLGHYDCL